MRRIFEDHERSRPLGVCNYERELSVASAFGIDAQTMFVVVTSTKGDCGAWCWIGAGKWDDPAVLLMIIAGCGTCDI